MMAQLSEHFYLAEAEITSHREIDNTVGAEVINALVQTARAMERVRACLKDSPIVINSWYRCKALNDAVGSGDYSQHLKGEAVDFVSPRFGSPLAIAKCLKENEILIRYDQLILEHTWVHISFTSPGIKPRGQVLSLLQNKKYAQGLTNKYGVPYES
jgi:putative chitinase